MTVRVYHTEPGLREWEALVVGRRTVGGHPAIVLDRTAIYPGGGGQPEDRGTIGDARVLSSLEQDSDIVHLIDRPVPQDVVRCTVDWARRTDLSQQHTAQHVLSEAFQRLLGAPTLAFHLSEESATIDIPGPAPTPEQLGAVEEMANQVVRQATPVEINWFEPGQPIPLPLRKAPDVSGQVRIVSVQGFDHSPCGGVHCANTAELGLIKILRVERRGREARVHFASGGRAMADYGTKSAVLATLSRHLSVGEGEVIAAVERLATEARAARKELETARAELLAAQVESLIAGAEPMGRGQLVARVFPGMDAERLKHLARSLADSGDCVALLASTSDRVHLVFARSPTLSADMGRLLRAAAPIVSGAGGGRPDIAQGGGSDVSRAAEAIDAAADLCRQWFASTQS